MQVLSWIDICAGLAAKTVARGPVVTASVDTVHFLRPCHQGSVAIIAAMVNRVFQSSMEARHCDLARVLMCTLVVYHELQLRVQNGGNLESGKLIFGRQV